MNTFCFSRRFLALLVLALLPLSSERQAQAADPLRNGMEFERRDIPDDRPNVWPKAVEKCVQEPRQSFLALMEQINSRDREPRPVSLKSIHYEAALVGDSLRGGVLTASVKHLESRRSLLELGKFTFALEHLKWQDRPAIWGASSDGNTWVVTDGTTDELLGEWSCRGRSIPGGFDFDMQLPPAATSFFDLRIPNHLSILAPGMEVAKLSASSTEESTLWRIHCSGDRRCRMTFLTRENVEKSQPLLTVEHDMHVTVREEEQRFQLTLYLEALDAPIHELILKGPAGLDIFSAVYGGDTPVAVRRTQGGQENGKFKVQLPGMLKGRKRTLRIEGSVEQKPGQPTIIPQISVENSLFDGGMVAVNVQPPLQELSVQVRGFRQRTADGDTATYQQLLPDAQLMLDVRRAEASLTGHLVNLLSADEETWNLVSELRWNSLAGSGYRTTSLFPPEWEITDVKLQNGSDRAPNTGLVEPSRINWDVKRTTKGDSALTVEFFDSVQAGQPRTVIVNAQRKAPLSGQFIPVPIPQMVNCDLTEIWFGLEIPSSMTSEFTSESRLERVASPASSRFSLPIDRQNVERHWYRCDSPENVGQIQLVPKLQPVDVAMETAVEALPAEYRVKYSIFSDQRETHADRLLVYLTESSSDIRWIWKGAQPVELNAVRLPKSRHVDWNLPSKGELWEFRLPRAIERGVAIEGTSINRWPASKRVALLYVPQAVHKQAEFKLTHPESLNLEYDTTGMKSVENSQTWVYSTAQAEFELSIRNPEPSREFPTMVSMQLYTQMSADRDGSDLYRVRLQLENGSSQETLSVKLDPSAIVQDVSVGGEPIKLALQNGEIVVPDLSAARRDLVELVYRVPARNILLRQHRRIIVPQVSARVLGFDWKFGIPSSSRLFTVPSGIAFLRQPDLPSWNERLFGPLARPGSQPIFSPWKRNSWKQLFSSQQPALPSNNSLDDTSVESLEWEAFAQTPPEYLWIELWHSERIRLIAWIAFGVCLLLGSVFRIQNWTFRDRAAAYGLGVTLAVGFFVTSPYTSILGGATAGILIGLLLPRSVLDWSTPVQRGSSDRLQVIGNTTFMMAVGFVTTMAIGQVLSEQAIGQDRPIENALPAKLPIVYVPVNKEGQPSNKMRWVYVPREALDQWTEIANESGRDPNYLISSARYNVSEGPDGNLDLLAKYQVHVLSPSMTNSIVLPLTEISLPHTDACRLNGRPHPIGLAPDGKGYIIELPKTVQQPVDALTEAIANEESKAPIETIDIEIRGKKPRPQASEFELRLPQVPNSQFEFEHPDSTSLAEIVGAFGALQRSADEKNSIGELGATSQIQVRWSQSIPVRNRPRLTVSMLQSLKMKAGYSQLNFTLVAGVEEGQLDGLEFDLPSNALLQKIQTPKDGLLHSEVFETAQGKRRLRIIFPQPTRTGVSVDGTLILVRAEPFAQTPLPEFGLAQTDHYQFQYSRNWWGVLTSSDFQLDRSNVDPEFVSTISPEAYLDAWNSSNDPRNGESLITDQPQFAFELREGVSPSFSLSPHHARRKAIQWRQIGFVGSHKLEWTVEGEIESSFVPTFQTVLLVDRRLRIEDISIKENRAERLSRWTESRDEPSRVVLFQNDRTQGIQRIRLRGSMSVSPGTPITLPTIRVEDCEMADDRLILTRDPEIDVAFDPPSDWLPLPPDGNVNDGMLLDTFEAIGHYQTRGSTSTASIRTESRHSRCTSRAYALLTRAEGTTWRLKYRLEMTPEGESPVRMGVEFPSVFPDWNAVTVDHAEPVWHDLRDRPRQLDLLLNRNESKETVVVRFEITVDEPKSSDWELLLPTPLLSQGHDTMVVIEPGTGWTAKGGRDQRRSDLPERLTEFYEDVADDSTIFSAAGNSIQLQKEVRIADFQEPAIRLLDQRVQIKTRGLRTGISFLYLSALQENLTLQLPANATVTSMFLDDNPLALGTISENRLQIPVEDIGGESVLAIAWSVAPSSTTSRSEEQVIWPLEIPIEQSLVTVTADDPIDLLCLSGVKITSSIAQTMDRLEVLLDRQSMLSAETHSAATNRWMIEQVSTKLKNMLGAKIREDYSFRWTQLQKRISQLETSSMVAPLSWSTQLVQGDETVNAIRGHAVQKQPIRIWNYDRRAMNVGLSTLFALFLIPIFRRLIRIEWSDWLVGHSALSWSVLAAFWWLFLTPSALGPAVLAGAFGGYLWKSFSRKSMAE